MVDFEKLGVFYLGREYDLAAGEAKADLVLYDSKDLTTHGVCVGMTGSGKTGLCLALLEEAAIDGVPALAIDPKGDLGNLLLTFPELRPEDFRPWVDPDQAARKGLTEDAYAAETARQWREGLAAWGQDGARIARLRKAADFVIYTPGSTAGVPLNVLHSFDAPPPELAADGEAVSDRLQSAVSGLLALLGLDPDPVRSREHILIANILQQAWNEERNLDLAGLIGAIQQPPFRTIGVLDLEQVYPAKERFALAVSLNNLLASPGFSAWMEGEPLDVQRLLWTPEGKPRIAILSIAHLSDAERMFFVTLLLNEVVAWMRRQPGTPSLRAILYMDEIFGYFPPTAMPPAKRPMLTLLKQARAYGLGVLLATQNPVDLDYKGLANTGTWFIGRLQTDRDKARVLDGLEGAAAASGGSFDRAQMDTLLSGLGNRVFLMHNVHEDAPVLLQTRWCMSYLRGPLTRAQIQQLTAGAAPSRGDGAPPAGALAARPADTGVAEVPPTRQPPTEAPAGPSRRDGLSSAGYFSARPAGVAMPVDIPQFYVPLRRPVPAGSRLLYTPGLLGAARLHYMRVGAQVDLWAEPVLLAEFPAAGETVRWEEATELDGRGLPLAEQPAAEAERGDLPPEASATASYADWRKSFEAFVYQQRPLTVYSCASPKAVSRPGEDEGAFRARLEQMAREQRDLAVEKLREKYAAEVVAIRERIRRAEDHLARETAERNRQAMQATLSVGETLIGALFGRKTLSRRNVERAGAAMRRAGRTAGEFSDVTRARETITEQQAKLAALEQELAAELAQVQTALPEPVVEEIVIRPRKNELMVTAFGIGWLPWAVEGPGGVVGLW